MIEKLKEKLNQVHEYAKTLNIKCLSTEYIDSKTKMEWKCENPNHPSWLRAYNKIKQGNLCPRCGIEARAKASILPNALETARLYAESKGGKCLSIEYINSNTKMEWKCENPNHTSWFAIYHNIVKYNKWCPECAKITIGNKNKNHKALETARLHAESKGGKCLSKDYVNSKTKMEWKCENFNHPSWFATYSNIVSNGHWCIPCGSEKKSKIFKNSLGLEIAESYAELKGGKCLSTEYNQAHEKLEWKCKDPNHDSWFSSFVAVVHGNGWCPKCGEKRNVQEYRVRNILNYLLDTSFVKTRLLDWNFNPVTKRKLELDGFSEELNIAFEFQGQQHFVDYYEDPKKFSDQQYRDKIKLENCNNNNVKLIIITETKASKLKGLLKEILQEFDKLSIMPINTIDIKKIEEIYFKSENNIYQIEYFNKAKNYAESKGGKCLSEEYINNIEKMEWKCENLNHPSWFKSYNETVNRETWCKKCKIKHDD